MHAGGLIADRAVGQRHVKGVKLAVTGDDLALGIDDDGGVVGFLPTGDLLAEAAAVDVDAVLSGLGHQDLGGVAGDGLVTAALTDILTREVHHLGEADEPDAFGGRLIDAAADGLEVFALVILAVKLHDGDLVLSQFFHGAGTAPLQYQIALASRLRSA